MIFCGLVLLYFRDFGKVMISMNTLTLGSTFPNLRPIMQTVGQGRNLPLLDLSIEISVFLTVLLR